MTLKELASKLRDNQNDVLKCTQIISYFEENYNSTIDINIDRQDLVNLDHFNICTILSLLEYISNRRRVSLPDWYKYYSNGICYKNNNYNYKILIDICYKLSINVNDVFAMAIQESPIEFSKRGLISDEFIK